MKNKYEIKRRVIFLDRDGVINVDTGYLCDKNKLEFISGSLEAMRLLQRNNFTLVIISNQSGLARGYFSLEKFNLFMEYYFQKLVSNGVEKPFFYFCPHHELGTVEPYSRKCNCRKPLPGMIFQAAKDLEINLKNSYLVGDRLTDVEAGFSAGIPNLYLLSRADGTEGLATTILHSDCLLSVAKVITNNC